MPNNETPDAEKTDDLKQLTDFRLIQQGRADIAFYKLAIEEGMDIDPQMVADLEAKLKVLEQSVEAERIALRAEAEAEQRMNRSADNYVAALNKVDKSKGN